MAKFINKLIYEAPNQLKADGTKGKASVIKGMKSKAGKNFNAVVLKFEDDKIKFEFVNDK